MINKNTKNKSFINMWRYLQDKNIENNTFMLELHDESLRDFKLEDLNIEDKDKRSYLMSKVIKECKENIWFFFREIIRIPNKIAYFSNQITSINSYEYVLNPEEMKIIYLYDNNISTLTKLNPDIPRGIKTTIYLLEIYDILFHMGNMNKNQSLILTYEKVINYDNYDMFINTNTAIISEYFLLDDIKKSTVFSPDPNDNIDYFLHIIGDYSKEKLLLDLVSIKLENDNNSKICGFLDNTNLSNNSNYELILFNILTSNICDELSIFDKTNELNSKKIYIIK